MSENKIVWNLENLGRALDRLREALKKPRKDQLAIDGTIQRFEFVFELYWKTLKEMLAVAQIEASYPKDYLRKAFQNGWLFDQDIWVRMLEDRNATSHIYNEPEARAVYKRIKIYFVEMEQVY